MKALSVATAVACALAQGVSATATARHHLKASGVSFGPKSCISLTRSGAGSCVISTDCEGVDTSGTEFAFDCVGQVGDGGIVRHSFGVGGFEANEEFDTEVKCDRCDKPTAAVDASAAAAASPPKPAARAAPPPSAPKPAPDAPLVYVPAPVAATATAQTAHELPTKPAYHNKPHKPFLAHELPTKPPRAQPKVEVIPRDVAGSVISYKRRSKHQSGGNQKFWPFTGGSAKAPEVPANPFAKSSEMVRYGPDGCVSVYKSAEGHCIMKTQCTDVDISHYEFGLVCVDKVGSPVRHLFGKDSFDPEETFDTLIKCDQCLGLEDIPDAVALNGEVMTMSKDIANLKAVMTNISINVQMLNTEVFGGGGPAPGPAPAPAKAAPPAKKALVHHSSQHRRMGSRQQNRGGDVNYGARRHNLRHSRGRRVVQEQRREQQHRQVEVEQDDQQDDRAQQDDRSNDEQDQDQQAQAGEAQATDDQQADDADRRDRQSDEDQPAPVQASSDRDEDNEGYDTGSAPSNNNAEEVIRDDDDGEQ